MVGIVPYAHDGMIKRIVLALLALGCLAMSGMAEASRMVDLTALDCYVRPGSSLEWSFYPPDPKDGQWLVVPATPGNRPVIVQNLAIPGKAPANPYALRAGKAETYSFVFVFEASEELLASSSGVGLYLAAVGKGWEIYLNGQPLFSEVFRNRSGWFERERAVRGALVDLDMRVLKPGRNVLDIVIYGNSSDDRTGLFTGGPYLIGDYQELLRLKSEYVDLMLIGIYLFFGLYHLVLFAIRPANKPYLYYGLGTLAFSIYLFSRTFIVYSLFRDTAFIRGVELSTLFVFFPLFLAFFDVCNRKGKVTAFTISFGIASVVLAFVAPFLWSEILLKVWQAGMPLMAVYLIVADIVLPVAKALGKGRGGTLGKRIRAFAHAEEFPTVVIAFLIFVLCAVALALGLNSLATLAAIKFGAFALIFGMAAYLASRFSALISDVEDLTTGLEGKVAERTSALAGAMDEQSGLNTSLQAANKTLQETLDASSKDMKIAIQVQQGIFPAPAAHPRRLGCGPDIAARGRRVRRFP